MKDFKPETRSLLNRLTKAGFKLVKGDNGEYGFTYDGNLAKFIDDLIACDETHLWVNAPATFESNYVNKRLWLFLVLGNSPGELVADCTYHPSLDKVTQEHYAQWEGRKQPTIVSA